MNSGKQSVPQDITNKDREQSELNEDQIKIKSKKKESNVEEVSDLDEELVWDSRRISK